MQVYLYVNVVHMQSAALRQPNFKCIKSAKLVKMIANTCMLPTPHRLLLNDKNRKAFNKIQASREEKTSGKGQRIG